MGTDGTCCTPGERRCSCEEVPVEFKRVQAASTEGMVELEGGPFLMGTVDPTGFVQDGEGPVRQVYVDPFYLDETSVTNAQFEKFSISSGYKTDAEKFGWSYVFHLFLDEKLRRGLSEAGKQLAGLEWWFAVEGADWKHPEGPDSDIEERMDHPATHISWRDAQAYCEWAGKRLPTEAEVEYAARGGLIQKKYAWGDQLTPGGRHMCNIWQGRFPHENTAEDGYVGTAPARSFEPNGFGLYNMAGNVWEWAFDRWSSNYHIGDTRRNPIGPPNGGRRVMRGGSYLCHFSYCNRYRVAARTSNTPDSSTGNMGFRCASDVAGN